MKIIKSFWLIFFVGFVGFQALAVNSVTGIKQESVSQLLHQVTVGQFIALDIDRLTSSKFVKMNWAQRSMLKMVQKKLARKVSKGKIDANETFLNKSAAKADGSKANSRGRLSLIFGSAGLLFLFLGPLAILSIPLSIAAIVLGVIGINKDENTTMAIIGLILGCLFAVFLLIGILLIASFGWI